MEAVRTEKYQRIPNYTRKNLEYQTILIFEMFSAVKGKKAFNSFFGIQCGKFVAGFQL
jgi:hypothetical protein